MREYFVGSAKNFQQSLGKRSLLISAIERHVPKTQSKRLKFLDVACGKGDIFELATSKGYSYFGFDISPKMIAEARQKYPTGKFIIGDIAKFIAKNQDKFDIVLINMLFPAIKSQKNIEKILRQTKSVLGTTGIVLIGVTHPCFDQYMQFGLLKREGIETKFNGYFNSGKLFRIHKKFEVGRIILEDYHWQLSDYFNAIKNAGFSIFRLDECEPSPIKGTDKKFIRERNKYPTYLLFVCK